MEYEQHAAECRGRAVLYVILQLPAIEAHSRIVVEWERESIL
jgi:hypothetical protein